LFERSANRVALNAAGEFFLAAVQSGFDTIELALEEMNRTGPTFLLAANPGFAQQWLVPHLDRLQDVLGDADLRLRLFDRDAELTGDAFDAAVHLIPVAGAPATSRTLFDERVVPVAAPDFAASAELDEHSTPDQLLEIVKLHLDTRDRQWMDWTSWFTANGVDWSPARRRLLYNNHALVMNEAMAGHGVALAWRGLVDPVLETGALVPVGPEVHRPEMAYHVIPGVSVPADAVDRVADWLSELTNA
ncbi:MAG: LysR substrate-binding domain-containing protein, partial [Acidimicrobiales bacterium]